MAVETSPTIDGARLRNWIFRLGFSSVFLVNGLIEFSDPYAHTSLMEQSILNFVIADFATLMRFVAFNDVLIAVLILTVRWNSFLMAWVGLWLLTVTALRLVSLIPAGDPVELFNSLLDIVNKLQ